MATVYDEGIFQNIVGVSWPSPATFVYFANNGTAAPSRGIDWRFIEDDKPVRNLAQFKKLWPEGNFGSGGGSDSYDFSGAETTESIWGANDPLFVRPIYNGTWNETNGPRYMRSGPWKKADGDLVANSDRPVRGYFLRRAFFAGINRWLYYGRICVLPSMDRYWETVRPGNNLQTFYRAECCNIDGTYTTYEGFPSGSSPFSVAEQRAGVDSLRDQINANSTGNSATTSQDATWAYIHVGQAVEGYGYAPMNSFAGMVKVSNEGGSVNFGSLDVDWSGNTGESIVVIA